MKEQMLIIEDRWGGIRATGCVSKWSIPRLCSIFKWEINYYILTIGFLGVLPILIDKATDLAMDHFGYPRNAITSCQKWTTICGSRLTHTILPIWLLIGRPGDTRNSQAWKDAEWPTLLVFQMDPETPGNIKQLQGTGDNSPKRQDPKHGHATLE